MRILDEDNDRTLSHVTLYLKLSEAAELRDSLTAIIEIPAGRHEHTPSSDYEKEITVCVYEEGKIDSFNERSKRIILEDS